MDRGPLPPHERPWRHPSELGPPEHEPTTRAGLVLIVTTATLSIALIGLLVLTVTPDRADDPISSGATTTRAAAVTFAALEQPDVPMVTPIGDEGWGVTTLGAAAGRSGTLAARLPTGDIVDVEIVKLDRSSGLTVVSLPTAEHGYELASAAPAPTDTVLVNARPPQVVPLDELAGLDVDEGTPVLDGDGDLVGICAGGDDGTRLRTVATMPAPRAMAPRPAPTSTPAMSVPATSAPPTSAGATTSTTTSTTTTSTTTTTVATTTAAAPAVSGGGANGGRD